MSVVLASLGERARLEMALGVVLAAAVGHDAEVLVARADTPSQLSELARVFTGVRFVMAPPGANRAELLSLGMVEASGHVVTLTDDEAATQENWTELLSHRRGAFQPGAIDGTTDRVPDWLQLLRARGVTPPGGA